MHGFISEISKHPIEMVVNNTYKPVSVNNPYYAIKSPEYSLLGSTCGISKHPLETVVPYFTSILRSTTLWFLVPCTQRPILDPTLTSPFLYAFQHKNTVKHSSNCGLGRTKKSCIRPWGCHEQKLPSSQHIRIHVVPLKGIAMWLKLNMNKQCLGRK